MRAVPQVKPPKQWYVLACEGGYIGNVFELFNNSPRRPRLMVTDDLQQAVIGTDGMIGEWQRLGREVLGVDSTKVPVRFEKNLKTKITMTVLDTRKDGYGKDTRVHERVGRG